MAIAASIMSHDDDKDDEHTHDMVMPGFRFHPTEEELVEFYLRRKVEGKRFQVELITFLDLYRYDPWELPALAAIGEKEWFFYVPRDRKYRNGDRPNRVTTSGYWKATGADRMIRTENFRSIGLKKTLVFYSGKAPKGTRTSWIMNEYRLPQQETERSQKAEISLCRVYKRAGVEDHHHSLPRSLPSRPSSSSRGTSQLDKKQQQGTAHHAMDSFQVFNEGRSQHQQMEMEQMNETDGSSTGRDVTTALGLSKHNNAYNNAIAPIAATLSPAVPLEEDHRVLLHQSKQAFCPTLFAGSSSNAVDDLHRLVSFQHQQASMNHQQQHYHSGHNHHSQFPSLPPQSQSLLALPPAFSDRLWEWNPVPEANRDYTTPFK